jgi:hypothetical protein
MVLWIGGRAQGKLALAKQKWPEAKILDVSETDAKGKEELLRSLEDALKDERLVWNHFHLFGRRALLLGMEPLEIWEKVASFVDERPDLVVICDEIGNGIVPMEPEERRYREETGRMLCKLAAKADSVERIFCGIPVRIK